MIRLIFDFLSGDDLSNNNPQSIDSLKSIVEESSSELCRKKIKLDDGIVDQVINIADSNSEYLIISCDQEITIKLNGSLDPISLIPRKSGVKSIVYYLRGSITGLLVSNSSGSECNIDIISVNV